MLPIPEFVRPIARNVIGIPGRYIPYPVQKQVLSLVLNQAFREPLKHGELDFLEGAKVRIRVTDLCIDWLIRVGKDKFTPIERTLERRCMHQRREPGFYSAGDPPGRSGYLVLSTPDSD